MRIRYPIALLLACLLAAGTAPKSRAQQRLSLHPRDVTRLHEAFPKAARKWTHDLDRVSKGRVTPLVALADTGIILVALDGQSVRCLGPGDRVLWQASAAPGAFIQGVTCSPDGRYIYLYYYKDEGVGFGEVLTSDGQSLWRRPAGFGYRFSLSGAYMFSQPNPLSYAPVRVLDTRTGRTLWTHDIGLDGLTKTISDLGPDKLVYIAGRALYIAELATGRQLWTRALGDLFPDDLNYAFWELVVSEDGDLFVVHERNGLSNTSHAIAFDGNGNILWRRDGPDYEQLIGLTPNGKFLALYSPNSLNLLNAETGTVIWTVEGRILNNGTVVMNDAILIHQNFNDTLIFVIDPAGRLIRQDRINRSLLFAGNPSRPSGLQRTDPQGVSVEVLLVDIQEDHLSFSVASKRR